MTPTELEILRRHAKPGHEEALVDIVTLMLERQKAEATRDVAPVGVPVPYPVAPAQPTYPGWPTPQPVPYDGWWPIPQTYITWTDSKITYGSGDHTVPRTETIDWVYNVHPAHGSGGPVHSLREVLYD